MNLELNVMVTESDRWFQERVRLKQKKLTQYVQDLDLILFRDTNSILVTRNGLFKTSPR